MICCALLTITRPTLADRARASAAAHGWRVLERTDFTREGAAINRNRLFQRARDDGYEYCHFLDDDDELTAPPETFASAMRSGVDVLYHNVECVGRDSIIYDGIHPLHDFATHGAIPGALVLRIGAFDAPFRESEPCLLGSWLWTDALRAGLSFRHVPVTGYRYHTDTTPCQITKRHDFEGHAKRFWRDFYAQVTA